MPEEVIYQTALRLLARREHTQKELKIKLLQRYPEDESIISRVLEQVLAEDLLSEQRFCDSYVQARVSRGYGPVKIAAELAERGVDAASAEAVLSQYREDWAGYARQAYRKRYGDSLPDSFEARAKRSQFLRYRGFESDHIREVAEQHENS